MRELSIQQQCEIQGGSFIGTAILYLLFGTAIYKLLRSKQGRISLPRFLHLEWRR